MIEKTIKEYQAERQNYFPKDRIAFYNTETSAYKDRVIFAKYAQGQITLESACKAIASNNHLESVTESQFLNEINMLGYLHIITEEEEKAIRDYSYKKK